MLRRGGLPVGRDDSPGVADVYLGTVEHDLDGAGEREHSAVSPPSLRLLLVPLLLRLWVQAGCNLSDDLPTGVTQGIGVAVVRNSIRMPRAA